MSKKPLDWLREHPFLMTTTLKGVRAASAGYKNFLTRYRMKPQSSTLFAVDSIATGMLRKGILGGLGIPADELTSKPLIGIANSWCEMNPGHVHLKELAESVKKGVLSAGGVPFEFNVPAPCDGMGNGNVGMRYVLPQRDLIADIVEMYVRSQWFDGMVTLSSCDKINPGMLMAAARLDLPTVCVPGGANFQQIRFEAGAESVNYRDYDDLRLKLAAGSCATCGACELVATANTMQCLMEALGLALPGSACMPAFAADKHRNAWESGRRVVRLIRDNVTPRQILTAEAIENAVMVDLAIGGSTNSTLHLPALAHELGLPFDLEIFNRFNKEVPTLCGIAPNGPFGVTDLFIAGGIPAVMKRLETKLHKGCLNVSGATVEQIIHTASVKNDDVVRSMESPFQKQGGTAVLYGNLAPEGGVIKQSAVSPKMMQFEGRALVFDDEADALKGLYDGKVKQDTVMVIRYEGPRGGPGMPELLTVTGAIEILGLDRVALVTDGRFSGATSGPCVGHVSPEAYVGGPIAAVRDGDFISIDIHERKISLGVSEEEIRSRMQTWKPVEHDVTPGFLRRYRATVSSASKGAVLPNS